MDIPIINYVRARTAFMPIMLVDNEASPETVDGTEAWFTLLPQGQRELTEEVDEGERIPGQVYFRAATEALPKGWTVLPTEEAAAAMVVARTYQLGGRVASGSGHIPLGTANVKIKEL